DESFSRTKNSAQCLATNSMSSSAKPFLRSHTRATWQRAGDFFAESCVKPSHISSKNVIVAKMGLLCGSASVHRHCATPKAKPNRRLRLLSTSATKKKLRLFWKIVRADWK